MTALKVWKMIVYLLKHPEHQSNPEAVIKYNMSKAFANMILTLALAPLEQEKHILL